MKKCLAPRIPHPRLLPITGGRAGEDFFQNIICEAFILF